MNPAPAQPRPGRWVRSWEGLIVLGTIVLLLIVLLFYKEENSRGARDWAQAKSRFEAEGESVDPAKFTPPPVPEAQNFGALRKKNTP
jgi:hypothetical protein